MSHLYEGMFILDNDIVRSGWAGAKAVVVDVLKKHGASVVTARRWDERKLAYPVRHKNRGTYLLSYFELGTDSGDALRRDLDLDERVLRYLLLRADDGLPEGERELASAEDAADFTVPEPPPDVEPQAPEPPPRRREERGREDTAPDRSSEKDGDEEPSTTEPTPEPALAEASEAKENE